MVRFTRENIVMAAVAPAVQERWYTVAEVAKLLRVGKDYVYARIKDGALTAVPLSDNGRKLRVTESALQAFMAARAGSAHTR